MANSASVASSRLKSTCSKRGAVVGAAIEFWMRPTFTTRGLRSCSGAASNLNALCRVRVRVRVCRVEASSREWAQLHTTRYAQKQRVEAKC